MRKRYARRVLAALGKQARAPTEAEREIVKLLSFNGTPEPRIAAGLGLSVLELRYWYADILGYEADRILGRAAATVIELAAQRTDLGVALKAADMMLRSRLPAWREPKAEEAKAPALERIESLTLFEVERELARLEDRTAEAGEEAAGPQGKPH
jgi:hypothetical protein